MLPLRPKAAARLDAPATEAAVPGLRHFAVDTARRWNVPAEAADRLALVVTELVTNVVLHSRSSDVALVIESDGEALTVEVLDSGSWCGRWSARQIAEDDVTGGRGLGIVRCCSSWLRVFASAAGTRVVACLALGPMIGH
ncbi:hypothetical protein GCM10009738_10220 [Kitasatospora viridis]